jgi:DNA-binding transcriptional regulator YhcF (GntR family)
VTRAGNTTRKYEKVAAMVRSLIADGVLLPGDFAPSSRKLARATGYADMTCRRGLRTLIKDGVLVPGATPSARPRVPGRVGENPHGAGRSLSAAFAARRRAAGLTQREVAELIGMSVTTVAHAETGRMWQSRDFWERADKAVNADGELLALHDAYRTAEIPAFPAAAVPDAAPGRVETTSVAPGSCAAVSSGAGDGPGLAGLLTGDERQAVRQAGLLYTFIAERVVAAGANRSDDLAELRAACHVIQRAVLAQAAARAYPEEFRLLGDVVTARSTGTGDNTWEPSPSGSGAAGQAAVMEDPRLWVRLKNDLARQIELGILEPGDEVWVAYTAKDAGVSLGTAAKALQALAKEGKLEPQSAPRPYLVPDSPPLEPPRGQQTPPPPAGRAADRPGSPP